MYLVELSLLLISGLLILVWGVVAFSIPIITDLPPEKRPKILIMR